MATKIGSLFGDITLNTKQLDKDIRKANRKLKAFGRSATQAGKSMALGFGTPVAVFGGTALNVFQNFEQEMAKVKAISGATAEEFKMLEKNATDLGATTRFTATNVSELQLNFSKLGFSAKEIEKVTKATLNLALATGEDLAESARVSAQTLRGFGLEASEMPRVTDVMAKGFSSSALDLSKFDTAMANVSASAKLSGISLERTTAMLGVLTNRGIDASSAGTGVRNMLLKSSEAGLTFDEALDKIANSLDPASTAMDLFGIRGATVGVTLALTQQETEALTKELMLSAGSAQEMADIMDATLQGSLFRLKSAFEGVQLELAKKLAPAVGDFLDKMADFMSQNKKAIADLLVLAGKVAVVGSTIGVLLVAVGQASFLLVNMSGAVSVLAKLFNIAVAPLGMLTKGLKGFNLTLGVTKVLTFGKQLGALIVIVGVLKGIIESFSSGNTDWKEAIVNAFVGIAVAVELVIDSISKLINKISTATKKLIKMVEPTKNAQTMNDLLDKYGVKRTQLTRAQRTAFGKGELYKGQTLEEFLIEGQFDPSKISGQYKQREKAKDSSFVDIKALFEKRKKDFQNILSGETNIMSMFDLGFKTNQEGEGAGAGGQTGADAVYDAETEARLAEAKKQLEQLGKATLDTNNEFTVFANSLNTSFKKALQDTITETKVTKEDMSATVGMMTDGLTEQFQNFFNGTKTGFKDLAKSILLELQRIIIKKQITNKILGIAFPSLTKEDGAGVQIPIEGTNFDGGFVKKGSTYLVGERGKELFTPSINGRITPNENIAGNQATVNFHITATDSKSFDDQMAQRQQMIVGMVEQAFNSQGKVGIYG
jgi:hypothetical protein|tara:strand:- start:4143 stop:6629 length:2487 start_codon:yes stop_codon:yes gene_type:complete